MFSPLCYLSVQSNEVVQMSLEYLIESLLVSEAFHVGGLAVQRSRRVLLSVTVLWSDLTLALPLSTDQRPDLNIMHEIDGELVAVVFLDAETAIDVATARKRAARVNFRTQTCHGRSYA